MNSLNDVFVFNQCLLLIPDDIFRSIFRWLVWLWYLVVFAFTMIPEPRSSPNNLNCNNLKVNMGISGCPILDSSEGLLFWFMFKVI